MTDLDTLCQIAMEFGFDGARYAEELSSDETARETEGDFALTQRVGVQGFPTLLGIRDGNANIIAHGFQPWDAIERVMDRWLARAITPTATS